MTGWRLWLFLGSLSGLLAVIAGAYGAHGLQGDPHLRDAFRTGVLYHLVHALALLAVAWLASRPETRRAASVHIAGAAFIAGTLLFSGTLYAFGLTGRIFVAGAAPVGGLFFMLGWAALAWTAARHR
ncbi:MAG: DUF423 domain-containing protein [Rhodospirillales bacterium]|nr:DUF423 domain-containing protein [Rhodospirillales bacterium]